MAMTSIVVPHYGSPSLTAACLAAIERATEGDEYEVVIVDNGTGHALPGRVLRNPTNEGFARACNQGAAATSSEFILFLNNDTEPQSGWLRPLVEAASRDHVAGAGSALIDHGGRPERALPRLIRGRDGRLDTENLALEGPRREVRLLCAASFLVRRSVFSDIGGFDEGYWNGHEDIDLCLKIEAKGWKLSFVPESQVVHYVSQAGPERFARAQLNVDRLDKLWRRRAEVDVRYPLSLLAVYSRWRRISAHRLSALSRAVGRRA